MSFNFWTSLWTVINLLVVIYVLKLLLYKPLTNMMREREQTIENNLAQAAKDREEAKEILAKYQAQINAARDEAQKLVDQATKTGDKIKEEIIAKANEEAQRMIEKAKADIHMEKEKALAMVRDEAAALIVLAAGKVVDREIKASDHDRLIKEFMDQVGNVQ